MKFFIVPFLLVLLSSSVFTVTRVSASDFPACKSQNGSVLSGSLDQLAQIMRSHAQKPQVLVTGIITHILPEDHNGRPHQKFMINVEGKAQLMIVSNLEFGRIPLTLGSTVSVCGEYLSVGTGMVHWTHIDPHGGHANGFTIADGRIYGEEEVTAN